MFFATFTNRSMSISVKWLHYQDTIVRSCMHQLENMRWRFPGLFFQDNSWNCVLLVYICDIWIWAPWVSRFAFFLGKRLLLRLSYLRFLSISSPVGLQESVDRRLSVWNYTLLVDSSIANKSGLILMFILSSLSCSDRCLASARGLSCALVLGIDKCFLAWSTHSLKLHTPSRVLIQHRRRSVLV